MIKKEKKAGEMKMKKILLIGIVLAILILPVFVSAATYYVSTSGSDNNPGTQSQPWKHCPGMRGWSGSGTLNAGDTVYFNSADTWSIRPQNYVLSITGGVTYIGDEWGSGTRATISPTTGLDRSIVWWADDDPVIKTVFKGFEIDGDNKLARAGIGLNFKYTTHHITGATKRIENCVVHDLADNPDGPSYHYGIMISGHNNYHVSNVEVIDCLVYNTASGGINVYPSNEQTTNKASNILISGCEVYNAGESDPSLGYGVLAKNDIENMTVEYCYLHDNSGFGLNVESNGASFNSGKGIVWRYNILANNKGGLYMRAPGDKSVEAYGNIIYGSTQQGLRVERSLSGTASFKIYNNIFYQDCTEKGSYEIYIESNPATITEFELKNNIIYASSNILPLIDEGGDLTDHSDNIYYRSGGGTLVRNGGSSYSSSNLNNWESSGYSSNPNFKNPSNLPTGFNSAQTQPNTDGFSIESGNAIDNGANLGSKYSTSINSVFRPSGSGWDIGAYELGSGSTPPPPPPSACTESDWSYSDGACQPSNSLTRTWTKIGICTGGISHPATETITCIYDSSGTTEIIIDDKNPGFITIGSWTEYTRADREHYGDSHQYHTTNGAGTGNNYATWTPNIAEPGRYEVYAWWWAGTQRPSNVPYTINYDGGFDTKIMNQQTNGGIWNLLGIYNFVSGTSGNIRISDENAGAGDIAADAVRLVYVGPTEYLEGDLNNNGKVDIQDLIIVASNFGRTSGFDERADTDKNNVIDIFDVVFVASRFT